jgi:hypothetical protein
MQNTYTRTIHAAERSSTSGVSSSNDERQTIKIYLEWISLRQVTISRTDVSYPVTDEELRQTR